MSQELSNYSNPLDALKAAYPQDPGDSYEKTFIPQIRFKAKTVLDDNEKVVYKAGTYVKVTRSEEKVGDNYEYTETAIGTKFTGDIIYSRYRLSFYDAGDNRYVSSPIFDDKENEIVKLFSGGKEVASGTAKELQALPEFQVTKDDKVTTALKLQKVLYVLIDGELHELTVAGGNVYAYGNYNRDLGKENTVPAAVHTTFDSEKTEYGGNKYNQMTFTKAGDLTDDEAVANVEQLKTLLDAIQAEKAFYGTRFATDAPAELAPAADEEF